MAKFTDRKGREHELVITVRTLRECRDKLQFDLPKLLSPGSDELTKIVDDPILMCELCYVVAQSSLPEGQRLAIEEFYDGLAGDALDAAMTAMLDAVADFYPRPDQRAFLRDLKEKAQAVTSHSLETAHQKLKSLQVDEILSDSPATTTTATPRNPSEPSSSVSSSPAS